MSITVHNVDSKLWTNLWILYYIYAKITEYFMFLYTPSKIFTLNSLYEIGKTNCIYDAT